jgi:hypothetical protein
MPAGQYDDGGFGSPYLFLHADHSMFCAAEGRAMTMRAALLLAAILAPTDALAGDAWPDSPNKLWFENLQATR